MERLTYKFPSLSLANFAANAVRKDGVGTVVNVQNGFVTVETTNAAAVNQITESVRGYEVFREAVAAPAGLPVRPTNAVAARLVNYKVPMTFVKQYPLLKKKKDALPGSKIMWSKDDNDLDVIAAKDVDSYTKDGWVIIEKFSEETMEVEILEAKLTPNTGVPAGASQDKFKKAAAVVKKAGYKATLGKGVPAGAKSEEVEEEEEIIEKVKLTPDQLKKIRAGVKKDTKKEEIEEEEEEELVTEVQTPERAKEMKKILNAAYKKQQADLQKAFKAGADEGDPLINKIDREMRKLDKLNDQEIASKTKLFGKGGKIVKEEIEEIAEQFGTDGTFATARFDGENSTVPVFCVTLNHKQYAAYGAKENMGSWSLFPVMATEDKNLVISKEAIATDVSAKNLFNRLYAGLISIHENFVASKGLSEDYKATLKGVRKVKIVKPVAFAKLDVGTTYTLMYDTSYMGEPMYKLGAEGKKQSGRISGKKIAKAIETGLAQAIKEEVEVDEEITPARQAIIDREKEKASKALNKGKTAAERDRGYVRGSRINYLELVHKYGRKSDKEGSPYQVNKRELNKWRKAEHGMREEVELDEAKGKVKYLTGPGKKDSKRIIGIYTMGGKWVKDMGTEKEAANFVNKSWGEEVELDEAKPLVGGQKKLDVNKNGKLDAHDFKALRAKKEETEVTEAMNNYIAFYNGKKMTVQAETSYKAQLKAIEMFKAPASKKHMVTVKLAN
jgi:hypothetical protein